MVDASSPSVDIRSKVIQYNSCTLSMETYELVYIHVCLRETEREYFYSASSKNRKPVEGRFTYIKSA